MTRRNEQFDFIRDASPQERGAFDVDRPVRVLLPEGTRLWKWSDFALVAGRPVSPWWSPLEPEALGPGEAFHPLAEVERRAKTAGGGARHVYRSGVAVLPHWNDMTAMVVISLRVDAYAFAGPAAMQQMEAFDGTLMPVYLAGGGWQLFVPGLQFPDIELCDVNAELTRVGLDPAFWGTHADYTQPIQLSAKTKRLLRLLGLPDDPAIS